MDITVAHALATSAPGRLPAKVGVTYRPPDQSGVVKYWCLRSAWPR